MSQFEGSTLEYTFLVLHYSLCSKRLCWYLSDRSNRLTRPLFAIE